MIVHTCGAHQALPDSSNVKRKSEICARIEAVSLPLSSRPRELRERSSSGSFRHARERSRYVIKEGRDASLNIHVE